MTRFDKIWNNSPSRDLSKGEWGWHKTCRPAIKLSRRHAAAVTSRHKSSQLTQWNWDEDMLLLLPCLGVFPPSDISFLILFCINKIFCKAIYEDILLNSFPSLTVATRKMQWRRICSTVVCYFNTFPFLLTFHCHILSLLVFASNLHLPLVKCFFFFRFSMLYFTFSLVLFLSQCFSLQESAPVSLRSCKDGWSPKGVGSDNCLRRVLNEQEGGIRTPPTSPTPPKIAQPTSTQLWSINFIWSDSTLLARIHPSLLDQLKPPDRLHPTQLNQPQPALLDQPQPTS